MCGIFGYMDLENKKTQKEICDIMIAGLEAVEYRGYDSAGICVIDSDKVFVYEKAVGKVENLKKKLEQINGSKSGKFVGIAHTRWATHGKSCEQNAHPVRSDKDENFFVVHNGIIMNYKEKKEFLESKGHKFETKTDTEVASKLAFYHYSQDKSLSFVSLVKKVVEECKGQSSFIFISKNYPNEIVAVHNGLPMIIGVENPVSENFEEGEMKMPVGDKTKFIISSDASSIVKHTSKAIWGSTGTLFHISKKGVFFHPLSKYDNETKPALSKIQISANGCDKGEYAHFMLKEIYEQKISVLNASRNRIDYESGKVMIDSLKSSVEKFKKANRFIFVACGTSYHSCLAVKKIFEYLCNKPITVEISSNFLDTEPYIDSKDVVFFISQSGETADSLTALSYCKKKGATTVGITNTPGSSIDKLTTCSMDIQAGVEKGVASTKCYTSQFMCLILVAIFISQEENLHEDKRKKIISEIQSIPDKVDSCLKVDIDSFVDEVMEKNSLLVISRGYQGATCFEGALKIKEISYIHCEGILAGELKHGPLALVTPEMTVITVVANDDFYDKSQNALEQVLARGCDPLVICTEDIKSKYTKCIAVPKTIDCLQGILTVIPFQLISYKLALKKGFDPDFPRNLAKSVTVE